MAEEKKARETLVLGRTKETLVRFSYLNPTPRLNRESGNEECSVQILIPRDSPEVAEVKAAIDRLFKAEFTAKKKPIPKLAWNPLRDPTVDTKNNGASYGSETEGFYILGAKTGNDMAGQVILPTLVSTTKDTDGKFVKITPRDIKSGDWGRIQVSLSAYSKGTGGVGAYFSLIQLVRQGDALGGAQASAEDAFEQFADDEEDPLA